MMSSTMAFFFSPPCQTIFLTAWKKPTIQFPSFQQAHGILYLVLSSLPLYDLKKKKRSSNSSLENKRK